MKVLQLNTTVNSGSTGRIAEDIGNLILGAKGESYIGFGRNERPSNSQKIKIGNQIDFLFHFVKSRLWDEHGLGSKRATIDFIHQLKKINPDVIHLHNVHGYYLNIEVLFKYLATLDKPIFWTFHDCWAFTGHCAYFERVNCQKWKTECHQCPLKNYYPASLFLDRSKQNFHLKKNLFTALKNLHIVVPSDWLASYVHQSYLKGFQVTTIHNGIDTSVFKPIDDQQVRAKYKLEGKKVILGVASIWHERKGLGDFIALDQLLNKEEQIVLVGLSQDQIKTLPEGIIGIDRTENIEEMAALYSAADVFVNPTYIDNFPTTNIEALACGTPVVTYDTGGSPEAIDAQTGLVVEKGNIEKLMEAIQQVQQKGKKAYATACRERAVSCFNKNIQFEKYLDLYQQALIHEKTF